MGLGTIAVPFFAHELFMSIVINSLPDTRSTEPIAQRLHMLQHTLEEEGSDAFPKYSDLLDKLTAILQTTELYREGGSDTAKKQPGKEDKQLKALAVKFAESLKDKDKSSKKRKTDDSAKSCPACPHLSNHTIDKCLKLKRMMESQTKAEGGKPPFKPKANKVVDEPQSKGKGSPSVTELKSILLDHMKVESNSSPLVATQLTDHTAPSPSPSKMNQRRSNPLFYDSGGSEKVCVARGVTVVNKEKGCVDSGASAIMCHDLSLFKDKQFKPYKTEQQYVYLGDDSPIPIEGKGTISLDIMGHKRNIDGVLYVPALVETLISVAHFLRGTGDMMCFDADSIYLYHRKSDRMVKIGKRIGMLYYLDVNENGSTIFKKYHARPVKSTSVTTRKSYLQWHVLLGHVGKTRLEKTLKEAQISYDFKNDKTDCLTCQLISHKRRSTRVDSLVKAPRFLYSIATDAFKLKVKAWNGAKYCSYIHDKHTHYDWVLWLSTMDKFADEFISFCKTIEVQHSQLLVSIGGDMGELDCNAIREYCRDHEPNRIKLMFSPPHTQSMNTVERPLGVTRERAQCMLYTAGLPQRMFNFAMDYSLEVGRLIFRLDTGKTPYEHVHGRKPDYNLHPFGCLVGVFVPKKLRKNRVLPGHKAEPGLFLGKSERRMFIVYKFRTSSVHEELHVRFLDTIFPGLTLKPQHTNPLADIEFDEVVEDEMSDPEYTGGSDCGVNDETASVPDDEFIISPDEDEETIEEEITVQDISQQGFTTLNKLM
jgi:hypothetical protein